MELFEKINLDITAAMKAQQKDRLTALRAIKSELLLLKTAEHATSISPEIEIKVLQKMVKQRKDAADIYKTQNRSDLYDKEMAEALIIEEYLPAQMSEEELVSILKEIIAQTGASSVKDMGKVIGAATKQLAGKAEGKLIAAKVKELLG